MRVEPIDRDLLEEQARDQLDCVDQRDLVIFLTASRASRDSSYRSVSDCA